MVATVAATAALGVLATPALLCTTGAPPVVATSRRESDGPANMKTRQFDVSTTPYTPPFSALAA